MLQGVHENWCLLATISHKLQWEWIDGQQDVCKVRLLECSHTDFCFHIAKWFTFSLFEGISWKTDSNEAGMTVHTCTCPKLDEQRSLSLLFCAQKKIYWFQFLKNVAHCTSWTRRKRLDYCISITCSIGLEDMSFHCFRSKISWKRKIISLLFPGQILRYLNESNLIRRFLCLLSLLGFFFCSRMLYWFWRKQYFLTALRDSFLLFLPVCFSRLISDSLKMISWEICSFSSSVFQQVFAMDLHTQRLIRTNWVFSVPTPVNIPHAHLVLWVGIINKSKKILNQNLSKPIL